MEILQEEEKRKMSVGDRRTSISYEKKSENVILNEHNSDCMNDEENAQLSLDPRIQIYLAQMSKESGCWSKCLPIPFERAAKKSWWDPTFDSEILEEQYKKSAIVYNRFKFRYIIVIPKLLLSHLTFVLSS